MANFLGQSNLIMTSVTGSSDGTVVVDCHGQKVGVDASRSHTTDGRGWLGVRPEKIFASEAGSEDHEGANVLTGGRVTDVSFVGVSTQYLVAMPWGQEIMVFEQNTGQRAPFRNGDEVDLAWSRGHAFLLDAGQDAHAGHDHARGRGMSVATEATVDGETTRRRGWGWLLLVPGMLYLGVFFVFPTIQLFFTSLYDPSGSFEQGYEMTWHFGNYVDALQDNWNLFVRSFVYAGTATALCLMLGYPLAYAIAFKSGRWKHVMLVLVIAPFFTSFLLRTLSWRTILADEGPVTQLPAVHRGPARRRPPAGHARWP